MLHNAISKCSLSLSLSPPNVTDNVSMTRRIFHGAIRDRILHANELLASILPELKSLRDVAISFDVDI